MLWKTLCLCCQTSLILRSAPNVQIMTNPLQRAINVTTLASTAAPEFSLNCKTDGAVSMAGLADSMPVIMARQSRRYKAKVAPELAGSGYCPTSSPINFS